MHSVLANRWRKGRRWWSHWLAMISPSSPNVCHRRWCNLSPLYFFFFFFWGGKPSLFNQFKDANSEPLFTCSLLWNSLPSSLGHPDVDFSRFRNALATYLGFPVTRHTQPVGFPIKISINQPKNKPRSCGTSCWCSSERVWVRFPIRRSVTLHTVGHEGSHCLFGHRH